MIDQRVHCSARVGEILRWQLERKRRFPMSAVPVEDADRRIHLLGIMAISSLHSVTVHQRVRRNPLLARLYDGGSGSTVDSR